MFNYNTSINKSTKITPFHLTFNYNPRVPLWSGVEHRFDKHLKNATGKNTYQKISQEGGHYTTTLGRSVTTTYNTQQT
jgi:hypothetical protein